MSDRDDDKLIGHIKSQLEASVQHLDGATQSKLTQARHRALSGLTRRRTAWLPAAVTAGVLAVTAIAVVRYVDVERRAASSVVAVEDVDMLASGEAPDFYEDLDFYTWLAEEHDDAG